MWASGSYLWPGLFLGSFTALALHLISQQGLITHYVESDDLGLRAHRGRATVSSLVAGTAQRGDKQAKHCDECYGRG